ncbi:hypothetical protein [Marinigracilibium pacificum]|uniref:Uncharacterized protein n=1 Tax=Marinigracilibium pacificum TaxID=2729599 RepID=A0A848IU86_9BACT|nr:hypothetical protein [Marinigracilibium pacificum]NMM46771.1 hypothetical protein [Marinigracilibium pacificum]
MKDSKKKPKKAEFESKPEEAKEVNSKVKEPPKGIADLPEDFDLKKLMGCGG